MRGEGSCGSGTHLGGAVAAEPPGEVLQLLLRGALGRGTRGASRSPGSMPLAARGRGRGPVRRDLHGRRRAVVLPLGLQDRPEQRVPAQLQRGLLAVLRQQRLLLRHCGPRPREPSPGTKTTTSSSSPTTSVSRWGPPWGGKLLVAHRHQQFGPGNEPPTSRPQAEGLLLLGRSKQTTSSSSVGTWACGGGREPRGAVEVGAGPGTRSHADLSLRRRPFTIPVNSHLKSQPVPNTER